MFTHDLPPIPAGHYKLFADVVHRSGFPETHDCGVDAGSRSGGDADFRATMRPGRAVRRRMARIVWDRPASIKARSADVFKFRLVDKDGKSGARYGIVHGNAGARGVREG